MVNPIAIPNCPANRTDLSSRCTCVNFGIGTFKKRAVTSSMTVPSFFGGICLVLFVFS